MAMCLPSGVLGTHPPLLRRGARSFKFASDFYILKYNIGGNLHFKFVKFSPRAAAPPRFLPDPFGPSDPRTVCKTRDHEHAAFRGLIAFPVSPVARACFSPSPRD